MKLEPRLKAFARELRKNQTECEERLWRELRALKEHGYRFRRQVIFQNYIVDFVCHSAKLIIEVDGDTHITGEDLRKDARRDAYLNSRGYSVCRVTNPDIYENLDGVMDDIMARIAPPTPNPSPQGGGGLQRAPLNCAPMKQDNHG